MRFGYNILFVMFFLAERAVLFFENVAARKLAGRIRPAFCPLQSGTQSRPGQTSGPLAACGQRGRSGRLLAIDPRPGTASLPPFRFVVSTTTSTGMAELRRLLPPHIQRIYYPADFAGAVRRAMKAIQPRAIILVEAELWPNFLWQAH